MKTKSFNKKLSLSKHTISNLNQGEMNGINGGNTVAGICHVRSYVKCFVTYFTNIIAASDTCITNQPSVRRSDCGVC